MDDKETNPQTEPRTDCPHCGRKLLSTRSILCNWCGQRIDDPAYLEHAAQERAIEDAKLREQLSKELNETAKMGVLGRIKKKAKSGDIERPLLIPPPDMKR